MQLTLRRCELRDAAFVIITAQFIANLLLRRKPARNQESTIDTKGAMEEAAMRAEIALFKEKLDSLASKTSLRRKSTIDKAH